MPSYELSSLWAQWIGSLAAVAAVVVAFAFGYLTYLNNRRSKDAQQRAALAAASGALDSAGHSAGPALAADASTGVDFVVRLRSGESWLLVNDGPGTAYDVSVEGLTDLDKRRLSVDDPAPLTVGPGGAKQFELRSRFTLSGPANVVVSYRLRPDAALIRRTLVVPAG